MICGKSNYSCTFGALIGVTILLGYRDFPQPKARILNSYHANHVIKTQNQCCDSLQNVSLLNGGDEGVKR